MRQPAPDRAGSTARAPGRCGRHAAWCCWCPAPAPGPRSRSPGATSRPSPATGSRPAPWPCPTTGSASFTRAAIRVRKAIRLTADLAGHRISVVGHSQGGALPVWAIKFWPGSARSVKDVVSLAGPFGGTQLGNELCTPGQCAVLAWQLRVGAHHVAALQHAPLPSGRRRAPSVTSLAGAYDEIVRPQPQASHLDGAVNIQLQDVCAADPSEHGVILGDPVGYALTLDALTPPRSRGPLPPARQHLPADVHPARRRGRLLPVLRERRPVHRRAGRPGPLGRRRAAGPGLRPPLGGLSQRWRLPCRPRP